MQSKKVFILALIGFLFLFSAPVQGRVYIDIDTPAFQRFPLAITDFKALRLDLQKGDWPQWFSDTLSRLLSITGYFSLIDKRAFLEDPNAGITAEGTRFSDWTMIGAEYLIKGGFLAEGQQLTSEFRLFDVVRGELVVGKRYYGTIDDKSRMVTAFANEVLLALTGEMGLFDTQIAFAKKEGDTADLYLINFDGTELTRITQYQSLTLAPRWSPDGKRLAFTSYREGNPDLYIRDLATGKTERVISYLGVNLPGSWSSDGKQLLVTLSRDGNQEIYDMNVETRLLRRLTRDFSIDVSPSRSPDGQRIAFVSNRAGSPQIYIMDADGGNVRRLTMEGNYNTSPAWSPKGKKIAYEGSVNGRFQIFLIDEEGGTPQQLTYGGSDHESPSWSPDGRYLAYSVRGYGRSLIEIINANGQNPRLLHEGKEGCQSPAWSPRLP
ncbi:MAG: Tol-Pal system beta propeller repeat protein TolB [Syntrophaceae bacterium]|nr:Tol-Pal system beta propeller repeat protein TolB [Syntrophaceae bacterium]